MQKSSAFPWHALLFALFPVVSLPANNVGQVDYSVAYRSLALSLVVSAAMLLLAKWLLRDWQKAFSERLSQPGHIYQSANLEYDE